MRFHSAVETKEAERQAKLRRFGFANMVRIDEANATAPTGQMYLLRVKTAVAERSEAFGAMASGQDFNRLFNDGAIYIERSKHENIDGCTQKVCR